MSNLKYWLWLTSRVGVSGQGMAELPVSYTHLTLPTICSV